MIQSITISDCVGPYSQCVLKGDILQCIDHAKRLGDEAVGKAYEKCKAE